MPWKQVPLSFHEYEYPSRSDLFAFASSHLLLCLNPYSDEHYLNSSNSRNFSSTTITTTSAIASTQPQIVVKYVMHIGQYL